MIQIRSNDSSFAYDIHSLIKAFFPKEEIQVGECFLACSPLQIELDIDEKEAVFALLEDGKTVKKDVVPVEGQPRKEVKNRLKRMIYDNISAYTGRTLPWGTLTGIRPVKIPMQMLEEGKSNVEIADYMRETYAISNEKAALSIMTANREREVLKNIDYENGYSIYVGIPFCPTTCLYCSFTSYPISRWRNMLDAYLDAMEKEIDYIKEVFRDKKLNTIYVGGGTPTTLEPEHLDRLLTKLADSFDYSHLQELTVEAGRPDSVTREKLEVLKKHKVDRISINPQTMKQETLDIIGRRHTVEQTKEAFLLARELGFDNINMDIIVGLPGETKEDVANTLEEIRELAPDSLTVHSLAVKRAARLNLFKEKYEELGLENSCEIMDMTAISAAEQGLYPYYLYRQKNMAGNFENVGYAKVDKAGIYNILIMEEKQTILAVGAGASTKMVYGADRIERVENVKDVAQYLERIDEMIARKREMFEQNGI